MERLFGCCSSKGKDKGKEVKGKKLESDFEKLTDLLNDANHCNLINADRQILREIVEEHKENKEVLYAVNRVIEVYEVNNYDSDYRSGSQAGSSASDTPKIQVLGAETLAKELNKPNEDAYITDQGRQIFIVCDGLSESEKSYEAAQWVCKNLPDRLSNLSNNYSEWENELKEIMFQSLKDLNAYAQTEHNGKSMQTTVCALMVKNGYAIISNIGDSRVYRQAQESKSLVQLTDDRFTLKMEEQPWIYQKVIAYLPSFENLSGNLSNIALNRGRINMFIGTYDSIENEEYIRENLTSVYVHKCMDGDKFILTSDGIHDNLTDDQIGHIVSTSSKPAKDLVNLAKQVSGQQDKDRAINKYRRPKPDDMTAIVMQVE